jgi:ATP-dependent helicase/nuclease subunit A
VLTTVVIPEGDDHLDLADADARRRILQALGATMFVEAGAGSGKTTALVSRVVALVIQDGIAVRHIAAVTFTDKAAAELRDRLRAAFEESEAAAPTDSPEAAAAQEALDDLDAAAIGTLHSFAQRILSEHPIEAGLPPLVAISDEVSSQVAFEERWRSLRGTLLSEPDTGRAVLLGLAAGLKLENLRSIALIFNGEWDRLERAVLATAAVAVPDLDLDVTALLAEARELCDLQSRCVHEGDGFLAQLQVLASWRDRLDAAPDDAARLEVLADGAKLTYRNGRKPNWPGCDLATAKTRLKALRDRCAAIRDETLDAVLRIVARRDRRSHHRGRSWPSERGQPGVPRPVGVGPRGAA